MDILEIEDVLKGLPDQALMQEAQQPTGQVPQYMVVSEIQRRSKMRKSFEAQKQQPSGTVREQILQEGIASVAPPPPQMMGAMGMPQQQLPPEMPGDVVVTPDRSYSIDQAGARVPIPTEQERAAVAAGMPPGDTGLPVSDYQYAVQQEMARRDREAYEKEMMQGSSPQAMPPQQMAAGGVVKMANEGRVPYRPSGSTLEEVAMNLYDYKPPMIMSGKQLRPDPSVPSREQQIRGVLGEDFESPGTFSLLPGRGARPKFLETVMSNPEYVDRLSQFLPKQELASTDGIPNALVEDGVKLGSGIGNTEDLLELIELGTSDTSPEKKVDNDLAIPVSNRVTPAVERAIPAVEVTDTETETGVEQAPDLYAGLRQRLAGVTFPTAKPDYSDAEAQFSSAIQSARDKINALPMDFSGFASDYAGLISEQERRAKKIREDAQKDIGSQALIQLGAGIMEGDTAGGLTRAAKSVADLKKQARQEAREEEAIARKMQIAQQDQRGELGIKGMQAERERQLALASLDEAEAKSLSSIAKSAADAKYAASVEEYKANIDSIVEEAKLIRYKDLQDEEKAANYRAIVAAVDDTLKVLVEEYYRNNPEATAEQLADYSARVMDQLVASQGVSNPYKEGTTNRVVDFPSVAGG